MLVYKQSTGELSRNGTVIANGYSGGGLRYMNQGSAEADSNHGPVPVGLYHIGLSFADKGKYGSVLSLTPTGHDARGRSGFLIHGDSLNPNHQGHASEGCIILPLDVREAIWQGSDRSLSVQK